MSVLYFVRAIFIFAFIYSVLVQLLECFCFVWPGNGPLKLMANYGPISISGPCCVCLKTMLLIVVTPPPSHEDVLNRGVTSFPWALVQGSRMGPCRTSILKHIAHVAMRSYSITNTDCHGSHGFLLGPMPKFKF